MIEPTKRFVGRTITQCTRVSARVSLAVRFARTPASRVIVLWLRDHYRFGPYLCAVFARRGYSIEVVQGSAYSPSPAMLRRMGLGMRRVSAARLNPVGKTVVTDDPDVAAGTGWKRRYLLDYDYYGSLTRAGNRSNGVIAPFFMHPNMYETGLDQRSTTLRASAKRIRVFFAGTVGEKAYGDEFVGPMLNRHVVMTTLLEAAGEAAVHVSRHTDRNAFLARSHGIVVALTHATEDTLVKHSLTQLEMLRFMASSDFFVCPPGSVIPTHTT